MLATSKNQNKSIRLFDPAGNLIEKSSVPNFDTGFFRSASANNNENKAVRKPYSHHAWTYAAIKRIIDPTAALPRALQNKKDRMDDLIYDHELLDLIKKPNPMLTGSEFWESIYFGLLLPTMYTPGGQVFLLFESGIKGVPFDWRSGKLPAEIWPYTDNVIKPRYKTTKNGIRMFDGWKMEINGQVIKEFETDSTEILRIRFINPNNPLQGLSPYAAVKNSILQDHKSDEFNTKFYDNYGAIGGLLTTDSENITIEELRLYKEHFEEEYSGSHNAGRLAALAHGLKYEQFVRSNVDMQFMEQRKDNRLRIQAAYGVNEEEIGIYEKGMNRATAEQADRSVWQKTRIPLDRKVLEIINIKWLSWYDKGQWELVTDRSEVDALRPDYSDRISDAVKLIIQGRVPPAEAFRVTGVPINCKDYPWLEKTFLPMNLVDAQLLSDSGFVSPVSPDKKPEKILLDIASRALATRQKSAIDLISCDKIDTLNQITIKNDIEKRDRIWESYNKAVLGPGEKSFQPKIEKHFFSLRNEILDNIDEWLKKQNKKSASLYIRNLVIDPKTFLFDLANAYKDLIETYKPELKDQMKRELKKLKADYGSVIQWKVNAENINAALKSREQKIKSINTTRFKSARKKITSIVNDGIENNLTPDEMARKLKEGINTLTKTTMGQAKVVARTEMGSVASWSRQDAFKSSDIRRHEWLSAKDERVRKPPESFYDHSIDGQVRNLGAQFSNDLKHPLDPNGAAGNVINCRCVALAVIDED